MAELLVLEYDCNSHTSQQHSLVLRQRSVLTLTNLTFGDSFNKVISVTSMRCEHVIQFRANNPVICHKPVVKLVLTTLLD